MYPLRKPWLEKRAVVTWLGPYYQDVLQFKQFVKMQLIIFTFLPVRDAFCWAENAPNPFWAGVRPGTHCRSLWRSPRKQTPYSRMGSAMPPPHTSPSCLVKSNTRRGRSRGVFVADAPGTKKTKKNWVGHSGGPNPKIYSSTKTHYFVRSLHKKIWFWEKKIRGGVPPTP